MKNLLKWNAIYEIGIKTMDEQHQMMISMMHKIGRDYKGKLLNGEFRSSLDQVIDYAEFHFSEEELFLSSIHYPNLQKHRKTHSDIKSRLNRCQKELNENPTTDSLRVIEEIEKWIEKDIVEDDKKYGQYINNYFEQSFDNKKDLPK